MIQYTTKKLPWRVAHTKLATQIVGSKLFRLVGGTPSFTSRGFTSFVMYLADMIKLIIKDSL